MDNKRCKKCEEENPELEKPEQKLERCQICHKYFCEDHAFTMSGVIFCSRGCGEYFFFGDPED